MYLEHQSTILESHLKYHVSLKAECLLKIQLLYYRSKLYFKYIYNKFLLFLTVFFIKTKIQKSYQTQTFICIYVCVYICISICLYWTGPFKKRQEAVQGRGEWGTGSGKDLWPEPKLRSAKAFAQTIWTICEYLSMSQAPFQV